MLWKQLRLTDLSRCSRSQSKPNLSREKGKGVEDEEDSDEEEALERLSVEDAWIFPVVRTYPVIRLASRWLTFSVSDSLGRSRFMGSTWSFTIMGVNGSISC